MASGLLGAALCASGVVLLAAEALAGPVPPWAPVAAAGLIGLGSWLCIEGRALRDGARHDAAPPAPLLRPRVPPRP